MCLLREGKQTHMVTSYNLHYQILESVSSAKYVGCTWPVWDPYNETEADWIDIVQNIGAPLCIQ